ncbi:MAG: hypothetical protein AB7I50_21705 [Vicinamibacterales bacterium]
MRTVIALVACLVVGTTAQAAPNVTNASQKGSLLVFPDIRVDTGWNTLIRIQNDGARDAYMKCYWLDGNKNRVDFTISLTRDQAIWFDAATGHGTLQVNPFPIGAANGFTAGNRHPFLAPGFGPYRRGMLTCWAIENASAQHQVKWNHFSGTATVYNAQNGAYEFGAFGFFAPIGTDLEPIGISGTLNLNGLQYDACPLYLMGHFTPAPLAPFNRLAVTSCSLNLNQDWIPVFTKLQFDVWNQEEVKFTGAYECADSWHDTTFQPGTVGQIDGTNPIVPGFVDGIDAAGENFAFATLGAFAARYRVQGIQSAQCDRAKADRSTVAAVKTQAVGLLGVQSALVSGRMVGTTVPGAGKFNGRVVWDVESCGCE